MARFYTGIAFKLFASLLTISFILLAVGGYAFYNQSETMLKSQILASLSNTASLQKIRVENAIQSEMNEFNSFAQRPALLRFIKNYLNSDDTALSNITLSLSTQLDAPYFEGIYLLNIHGAFVQVGGSSLSIDAQKELYLMGVDASQLLVHDFGHGAHVYVCGPMILDGEKLCVAVFEKNAETIGRITNIACASHESEETVLAYRGHEGEARFFSKLRFANASTIIVTPDKFNVPMIEALRGEETTLDYAPDYRGVIVLASTRYIESADIGLVTKIDLSEAYTPIYEMRNWILLVGGVTVIIVVVFSYFFAKGVSQPIIALKKECDRISGDELFAFAAPEKDDEIGGLQSSFEKMVVRLRRSFEEIEEKNIQLESLNKELESFSYSVSHDLRAPLRSIDGFSKIILEDYDEKLDDTGRDYLHRIRAATQRMGHLIDDLLALSRITRMELKLKAVDLSALALGIADEIKQRDPSREVEWRIQKDLITRGDDELVKIALTNLMENSWKFTSKKDHATIEVGSTTINGEKTYFVRDDGAGFDVRYVQKLFAPFQRLHAAADYPGTGIGLAIVQRVINRLGGRVWAEGEEGKGATFYFTIRI